MDSTHETVLGIVHWVVALSFVLARIPDAIHLDSVEWLSRNRIRNKKAPMLFLPTVMHSVSGNCLIKRRRSLIHIVDHTHNDRRVTAEVTDAQLPSNPRNADAVFSESPTAATTATATTLRWHKKNRKRKEDWSPVEINFGQYAIGVVTGIGEGSPFTVDGSIAIVIMCTYNIDRIFPCTHICKHTSTTSTTRSAT